MAQIISVYPWLYRAVELLAFFSELQSAGIGGCAHLVNFAGTDTIAAITTARRYYGCDIAGFSVPAAEHR